MSAAPTLLTVERLEQGLDAGFEALLQRYETLGGNLFYGYSKTGDPLNYKGPLIWSEGDCAFRFAHELEERFPELVHLEMPIGKTYFADFDRERDKRQFIDIVISDLSDFAVGEDVFAERAHNAFVEVKYIPKRLAPPFLRDSHRNVNAILGDGERLKIHLDRKTRCSVAAVLVVDDDDFFEREVFEREFDDDPSPMFKPPAFKWDAWPKDVRLLLVSARQVARRRGTSGLPARCPNPDCGSPRVAPIVLGLPGEELEKASRNREVLLGGCIVSSDGSDPPWGCIDCGYKERGQEAESTA